MFRIHVQGPTECPDRFLWFAQFSIADPHVCHDISITGVDLQDFLVGFHGLCMITGVEIVVPKLHESANVVRLDCQPFLQVVYSCFQISLLVWFRRDGAWRLVRRRLRYLASTPKILCQPESRPRRTPTILATKRFFSRNLLPDNFILA